MRLKSLINAFNKKIITCVLYTNSTELYVLVIFSMNGYAELRK